MLFLPFGSMLVLDGDVGHGGIVGSPGNVRFHAAIIPTKDAKVQAELVKVLQDATDLSEGQAACDLFERINDGLQAWSMKSTKHRLAAALQKIENFQTVTAVRMRELDSAIRAAGFETFPAEEKEAHGQSVWRSDSQEGDEKSAAKRVVQ